jgi:hypothetical protein
VEPGVVYVLTQDTLRVASPPLGVYRTEDRARAAASMLDRFFGEPRIHPIPLDGPPITQGDAM